MLKSLEINGFKSFGNKSKLIFDAPVSAVVGPNGSGKSNAAEAFRFVLGEQSLKALRARNSDELLFNGGESGTRCNRASVKAVFDNSSGTLDIDYNEVVIERIVQRGDASTYRINDSQVRLKDVVDLLSDANIGTSRHHIISQGETDRILNVHETERKSMIEDALGLRRFYRKRREAIQRLEKTEGNLSQVQTRQRDLEPELKFLTRQKNRIEETKVLRKELTDKYQKFFKRQAILLTHQEEKLAQQVSVLKTEHNDTAQKIQETKKIIPESTTTNDEDEKNKKHRIETAKQLQIIEKNLTDTTEKHGEVTGQLQALRDNQQKQPAREPRISIKNELFVKHKNTFNDLLSRVETVDSSDKDDLFTKITQALRNFLADINESEQIEQIDHSDRIEQLEKQQGKLREKREDLKTQQQELRQKEQELEKEQRREESVQHEAEKQLVQLEAKQENITAELERTQEKQSEVTTAQERLGDEKSEARIICGKEALNTEAAPLVTADGSEVTAEELLERFSKNNDREFNRELERLKIKLENTRVSDEKEVLKEYNRVKEQIDFLKGEVADLKESKESLLELIEDIEITVAEKFDHGLKAVNKAFSDFFAMMFDGGSAKLFLTEHPQGKKGLVEDMDEDPDETERGVGIDISLPKKKLHGLGVLSGGERTLVSIALLFALSQINPPPFVVLDEADAALDEANSRRFGNIIKRLSEQSQLVIITHNRETMTQADVLYGVTMDQHGSSRLLSLNFSEAVETVTES